MMHDCLHGKKRNTPFQLQNLERGKLLQGKLALIQPWRGDSIYCLHLASPSQNYDLPCTCTYVLNTEKLRN